MGEFLSVYLSTHGTLAKMVSLDDTTDTSSGIVIYFAGMVTAVAWKGAEPAAEINRKSFVSLASEELESLNLFPVQTFPSSRGWRKTW